MKIKIDENLPDSLVADLRKAGHDTDSVMDEGIAGHPDADVFAAAQRDGRFLITQGLDFSDIRKYRPGTVVVGFGFGLARRPLASDSPESLPRPSASFT